MAYLAGETATLEVGATSTTSAVTQVTDISFSGFTQDSVDTFHLGSTSKTSRAGLVDFGTLSFNLYYDPADTNHILLEDSSSDKATVYFEVAVGTRTWTGSGYVTSFGGEGMAVEENVATPVEIKINAITGATSA